MGVRSPTQRVDVVAPVVSVEVVDFVKGELDSSQLPGEPPGSDAAGLPMSSFGVNR